MKLMLWPRDEGFMDPDFRDGDIFQVQPAEWVPGSSETQRFLVIDIADRDYGDDLKAELEKSEYAPGAGGETVLRRQRAYRVDWRAKLTPDEVTAAADPAVNVPVITGRFTVADIARK